MRAKDYLTSETGKDFLRDIVTLEKQAWESFHKKDYHGVAKVLDRLVEMENCLSVLNDTGNLCDEDFCYLRHSRRQLVYRVEDLMEILG